MSNVSELNKDLCTGCRYCENICPQKAITMTEDECGFLYPSVSDKCTNCGMCVKKCAYLSEKKLIKPIKSYACVRKNKEALKFSSSGGVFAGVAENLIKHGGWYVAGCIIDSCFHPKHATTSELSVLKSMYGSKYVQSDMSNVYKEIANQLKNGYKVLFSGTPCQVNAIKQYTKNNDNLYTIEIICHGVTNEKMFRSYINMLSKSRKINKFVFRDKNQGWSYNNKIVYEDGTVRKLNHRLSSYMTYYLNGELYRESCYSCKYAQEKRGADLTIGDFWGILKQRPDLKKSIDIEKGVSCLLVNTNKGIELLNDSELDIYLVNYDDIRKGNEPLNHPSVCSDNREVVMGKWLERNNWSDVEAYWRKNDYRTSYMIWSKMPPKIQHIVRILLHKR